MKIESRQTAVRPGPPDQQEDPCSPATWPAAPESTAVGGDALHRCGGHGTVVDVDVVDVDVVEVEVLDVEVEVDVELVEVEVVCAATRPGRASAATETAAVRAMRYP